MPIYTYYCPKCGFEFEKVKPMSLLEKIELCPRCWSQARIRFTPVNCSFGWRLTERAHKRFMPKDEVERDI